MSEKRKRVQRAPQRAGPFPLGLERPSKEDQYGIFGDRPAEAALIAFDADSEGLPIFHTLPWSTERLNEEEENCLAFLRKYNLVQFPYSPRAVLNSIKDQRTRELIKAVADMARTIYALKKWSSRQPKSMYDIAGLIHAAYSLGCCKLQLQLIGWYGGPDVEEGYDRTKRSSRGASTGGRNSKMLTLEQDRECARRMQSYLRAGVSFDYASKRVAEELKDLPDDFPKVSYKTVGRAYERICGKIV